jgi:hypothetical protein
LSTKSEIIHCPNCKEDVPKTLYCLNCGYPLYKLEKDITNEDTEAGPASDSEPRLGGKGEVDMSVEYEPPQMTYMADEPRDDPEPEPETEPEEEPEPEPEVEIKVEEEPEPETEPEEKEKVDMSIEDEPEKEYEPEPIYELALEPEDVPEPISLDVKDDYMMDNVTLEFAPDPLTREVMDSLAKNITLKIRLIRLLRDNAVKEETFKKLFDSYVDQGRLWVSRRDEIIRRFNSDLERMEKEVISARKDFELLEIRKNIGDAGEEEYGVKAPAYKWDIEHLDSEIKNSKGGIQYMINLQLLVPGEEVEELENLAQSDFSELDTIEGVSPDTIVKMKETLSEALNTLQG